MHSYEIQSSVWEMIHLNFYCGYKAKLFQYDTGKCNLCGKIEEGSHHIMTTCQVMIGCILAFTDLLKKCNSTDIYEDEVVFGLVGLFDGFDDKDKIRNFITYIIRHCVFRNRHKNYGSIENATFILIKCIKHKINRELSDKLIIYRHKNAETEFVEKYLIENIIGELRDGNLILNV